MEMERKKQQQRSVREARMLREEQAQKAQMSRTRSKIGADTVEMIQRMFSQAPNSQLAKQPGLSSVKRMVRTGAGVNLLGSQRLVGFSRRSRLSAQGVGALDE
jgi:predicted metalloprotease